MTESSKRLPPGAERSPGGDTARSVPVRSGRIITTFCARRATRDASSLVGHRLSVASHRGVDVFSIAGLGDPHPSLPGIVGLARRGPTLARRVWPCPAPQPGLRIATSRHAPRARTNQAGQVGGGAGRRWRRPAGTLAGLVVPRRCSSSRYRMGWCAKAPVATSSAIGSGSVWASRSSVRRV